MTVPNPIEPLSAVVDHAATARAQAVGVVMYLIAAFLFALNGSIAKAQIDAGLTAAQVNEIRTLGAMVALLAYLLVTRPSSLRVSRRDIPFLLVFGLVAYGATPYLYFVTITFLPIGIATLLAFTAPLFVALWLHFVRHERIGRTIWLALALVIVGMVLVAQVWAGVTLNPVGLLLGLIMAISLAAYLLLGEEGTRRMDSLSLAFWGFAIASAFWSIVYPWWDFPWAVLGDTTSLMDGALSGVPVWGLVLWMVLLGALAPFLLVLGSLKRIGAQRGGIIGTSEPIWATLLAFILLGQTITAVQGLGGLVVLGGIIIAELSSQRAHRQGALTS